MFGTLKRITLLATLLASGVVMASAPEEIVGTKNLLVVGARPWDLNIQGVANLENAHFVDSMTVTLGVVPPSPLPSNFHKIDFNSRAFFYFAVTNTAKFATILFDWATFQHVKLLRWHEFAMLLNHSGVLIIPVMSLSCRPRAVAGLLADTLRSQNNFSRIEVLDYEDLPLFAEADDLYHHHRLGTTESAIASPAVYIRAIRNSIEFSDFDD